MVAICRKRLKISEFRLLYLLLFYLLASVFFWYNKFKGGCINGHFGSKRKSFGNNES